MAGFLRDLRVLNYSSQPVLRSRLAGDLKGAKANTPPQGVLKGCSTARVYLGWFEHC
jgi:hypothetical protein